LRLKYFTLTTILGTLKKYQFDTFHLRVNGCWNLIWVLQAPPKVKNILWRICRQCVPTRDRLREKGVDCPQICALCNCDEEDIMHLFFKCPSSQNVWSMTSFSQVVSNVVDNTCVDKAVFACILWSIWKQQNNQIWNNVTNAQNFVFSRAINMLQDWKVVRVVAAKPNSDQRASTRNSWCKPVTGKVKCNIDASFPPNSNRVGIGICIRDDQGAFILAKTEWFTPKCELHLGEAPQRSIGFMNLI
jgi:hypothetical protein